MSKKLDTRVRDTENPDWPVRFAELISLPIQAFVYGYVLMEYWKLLVAFKLTTLSLSYWHACLIAAAFLPLLSRLPNKLIKTASSKGEKILLLIATPLVVLFYAMPLCQVIFTFFIDT